MNNSITKENLLRVFPEVLKRSESISALGELMADYLCSSAIDTELCSFYTRIDALPESLLDLLAYDFKIDWWDGDLAIDQKRQVFKASFYIHKHLGATKSVNDAISAVYPKSIAQEWFDYGGEPYHFKLNVNITDDALDAERHAALLANVDLYKSVRSVLDDVKYFIHKEELSSLNLYAGIGMQVAKAMDVDCATPTIEVVDYLTEEQNVILTDEDDVWMAM